MTTVKQVLTAHSVLLGKLRSDGRPSSLIVFTFDKVEESDDLEFAEEPEIVAPPLEFVPAAGERVVFEDGGSFEGGGSFVVKEVAHVFYSESGFLHHQVEVCLKEVERDGV